MRRKFYLPTIIAILVMLAALAFLALAFLPYGTLKHLADSLMRDGNFKSLKESNALVFRILLGVVGLILLGAAYAIGFGRLKQVRAWFRQYWAEVIAFLKTLKPAKVDRVSLAVLLLILALAVVFRLAHIYDVMTHDESYTFVVFSSTSLFNILTNYQLPNNHILNSLLIYFSTHLFGIQPWAIRLPALIAGLLLIPACYAVARAVYDRTTALASALLVAMLPGAILYSASGRGYSLVALCTLLTLWLAIYVRENKNLFAWSLIILFSALGFYSVPVMLIPFGMVFAWLFLEGLAAGPGPYGSKLSFFKHWLVTGIGTAVFVLLLYTPVFIYTGADKVFANHWVTPEPWSGYLGSVPGQFLGFWHEWTGGLASIWAVLIIAGFVLGLIFHGHLTRVRFPLQAAAFLWITALLLVQRPEGVSKIWAFLQAPFMIWAAAGIIGLLKGLRLKFAWNVSAAAVALGLAVLIVSVEAAQVVPTIPRRWARKGAAENSVLFIKDQLSPQDLIIIDSPYDTAVWYYSILYGIPRDRFDNRRPFDRLLVIVSHSDGQTVRSVLKDRGPDLTLVNLEAAHFLQNFQNLDTYVVPHE